MTSGQYTRADGSPVHLRKAEGTVPMWALWMVVLSGLIIGTAICAGILRFWRVAQTSEDTYNRDVADALKRHGPFYIVRDELFTRNGGVNSAEVGESTSQLADDFDQELAQDFEKLDGVHGNNADLVELTVQDPITEFV